MRRYVVVLLVSLLLAGCSYKHAEFCEEFGAQRSAEAQLLSFDERRALLKEYLSAFDGDPTDYIITKKSADGSLPLRADMVTQFGARLFTSALFLDEPDVAMWLLTQGVDPFQTDGVTTLAMTILFEENWRELYDRADEATGYRYSEQFDEYRRFRRHCM